MRTSLASQGTCLRVTRALPASMMHTSRVTELSLLWGTRLGEAKLYPHLHEDRVPKDVFACRGPRGMWNSKLCLKRLLSRQGVLLGLGR